MKFINTQEEFTEIKHSLSNLLDIKKKFPEDPFVNKKTKDNMIFLDPYSFDYRRPYLFRMIKSLLKRTCLSECVVIIIDDANNQYHFDAFNTFPAFIFSSDDTEQDINGALCKELGSEGSFSLMLGITQHFVIYPKTQKWIIIADRSFDIAIAAFDDPKDMELFNQFDKGVCYDDLDDALIFLERTGKKEEEIRTFAYNFSP